MTIGTDENVLRLEVAVNDTSGVQTLDTLDNFGSIEPCTVATKPAPARQLGCEVTARVEVL